MLTIWLLPIQGGTDVWAERTEDNTPPRLQWRITIDRLEDCVDKRVDVVHMSVVKRFSLP